MLSFSSGLDNLHLEVKLGFRGCLQRSYVHCLPKRYWLKIFPTIQDNVNATQR